MRSSSTRGIIMMLSTFFMVGLSVEKAFAAPADDAPVKIEFESDSRLDRHVSIEATGVPLDQLFAKLGSANLELGVDAKCAAQRLQMSLHDRSLRTLLRSVAELLPGYWKPYANGRGYMFYMTNKALSQREEWWRLYLKQHDAALEAQRRYVVERLEEKPKAVVGEGLSDNQFAQIQNAQTFYYALSHDLKLAVAGHLVDTLMYSTANIFASDGSMEEGAVAIRLSDAPQECRQAIHNDDLGQFLAKQHIPDTDVVLSIANEGRSLTLHMLLPSGRELQSDFGFRVGQALESAPLGLKHRFLVDVVKKLGKRAPVDWKRLAAYEEGRVWPNDAPADSSLMHTNSAFGPPRLAECLERLKGASHIEFIADYYDHSGTSLTAEEKVKRPAASLRQLPRITASHSGPF